MVLVICGTLQNIFLYNSSKLIGSIGAETDNQQILIICKHSAIELEVKRLLKTVKAVYKNGVIEPLEEIELPDGAEITITVSEDKRAAHDGLDRSFGGWIGLIDAEKFLEDVYADRYISTRGEVKL